MSGAHRILAKAVDPGSRSEAIVVSFGSEWYESLRGRRFTAVIRKRVPVSIQPRWLYIHINKPKSAICARAEIRAVEMIDRSSALKMWRELDLSEEQILNYLGGQASIGCYRLGEILYPDGDVAVEQISAHMVYYAPQSFFVLSKDAKELLDRLCEFKQDVFARRKGS